MGSEQKKLAGLMVALITPYAADGSIDFAALDKHINRLIAAGVHGLVPGGSTGEFTVLSTEERQAVVEQTVKSAKGRVPVVAGVGDLSTRTTIAHAQHAAKVGAAAVMVVPPFYDAPNLEQVRNLLYDVKQASGLPIMYYNIPSASGVALTPAEIAGLAEVGADYVKDTSGDGPGLTELLFALSDRVTTFNGTDTLTFYGLAAGATGSIWGATNFIPELSMELWDAMVVKGDIQKGRQIWAKIFPICKFLESHNYCAAVKTAMELRGWKTGGVREPFALLEGADKDNIALYLRAAGVQLV